MNDHRWSDVYDYACKAFGQTPRPEDEAAILEAFKKNPRWVMNQIDEVANALSDGSIRWAWSTFAGRADRMPGPSHEVVVSSTHTKEKLILNAEKWMRNAGMHFDNQDEIEDELFGSQGRLRDYHADAVLRQRMVTLWRELRPTGERIEQDALDRAEAWKKAQAILNTPPQDRPL